MASRGRRSIVLGVVVLIGLLSTGAVTSALYDQARDEIAIRFAAAAEDQADRVVEELRRGVAVGEAARAFALASEDVTAEEWEVFIEQLRLGERFPAANGVGLQVAIPAGSEAALEAEARAAGQDGFTVSPAEPVGDVRYVVVYFEPEAVNREAIGFDVRSNPDAFEAAERALQARAPRLSGPTRLVQETGDQAGVVVYLPYIRPGAGTERLVDAGFVTVVFRGDELLSGILSPSGALALEVVDPQGRGPAGDGTVGHASPEGTEDAPVRHQAVLSRQVLGRTWQITVSAVDGYAVEAAAPVITAVLGLLLTGVVALLVSNAQRQEQRAQALADAATADLRASEAELAAANTALEVSNANLKRSNDELSRFAHVASHDLKEPLRMVSGFAGLLETQLHDRLGGDGLTEMERTSLTYIRRGASRMQELITDLLELASLDRSASLRETVDVRAVVDRVLEDLADQMADEGATVEVGPLDPVVVDRRQIGGLVQNLLTNAIKFRRPDVPPVVQVSAVRDGRIWRLDVADNGIGIAEADREVVFEAFRRIHSREEYEGTGIGLAICASVVTAHGGTIHIEDGIDGGTRFTVEIPQPEAPEVEGAGGA
ncbi:CHASE domain-containing protein [Euzebya sp.]|uniref:sensor histidine kinase n=1 Tax=Euzebya sp. TaxID=1971409 RepID=UPI0035180869